MLNLVNLILNLIEGNCKNELIIILNNNNKYIYRNRKQLSCSFTMVIFTHPPSIYYICFIHCPVVLI